MSRRRTAFPFADDVDDRGHLLPMTPAALRTPPPVNVPARATPTAQPTPARETARASQTWLRGDLADLARRLALEIASEMRYAHADDRVPGLGETLRLLAIHHGDLAAGPDELERRRVAALRRALQRRETTA